MAMIEGRRALLVAPKDDGGVTEGLRSAGFHVDRAARPAEARVQASRKPFTFVLCDACFEEGDVQALLSPLRARGVRTIVVSPDSAEEDADLAARYGADEVLRTPLKRPASQRMAGR
jgi:DNA-binding response OmpR family regulator